MPSNNRKTTKKTYKNKYLSVRFVAHIVGVLIIITLSFFVFRHDQIVNELSKANHKQDVSDMINASNRSFVVDIVNDTAYLPDLKLKYEYDNQAMKSLLYRSMNGIDSEINSGQAIILDTDNIFDNMYDTASKGCFQPYFIVTVDYIEEGLNNIFDKKLSDGRQYRLYQNSDQGCQGYITSETGRMIIESLKSAESY